VLELKNQVNQGTSLQDQLDQITQNTRRLVGAELMAFSEKSTAELFASGIEDRALRRGAVAPPFVLPDATGKPVRSSDLLAIGPLVVSFFRGRWCPYDITELETWQRLYSSLLQRGALFVAISPQTTRQNAFMAGERGLTFPMLSDLDCSVAESFGLAYTVPPPQRSYFQRILINVPYHNAGLTYHTATESSWRLPLPGIFVVRQDSTLAFVEAHADFRVRPEPADVMRALGKISEA